MIAVGLIEYGGQRAPLSVAAIGTGAAQSIIVIGAGWHHHWGIVVGSLLGTLIAIAVFAASAGRRSGLSRSLEVTADRPCSSPVAGSADWASAPTAVGAGFWIATYFFCMVGAWSLARQSARAKAPRPIADRPVPPVFATPLVSAIAVALAASLIAGADEPTMDGMSQRRAPRS